MPRFTVVYDACVLYPAPLRDLLIELASAHLFMAKWTEQIHEEWIENLLANRPDLTRARLMRTKALMDAAVPDCRIEAYSHLNPIVTGIPDENDRHVVAAAIHARADAIVTFNLRDFPADQLARFNLEALHPDDFIANQIDLDRAAVLEAAKNCRMRLNNPSIEPMHYLETLKSQSLPKTVDALLPYASTI